MVVNARHMKAVPGRKTDVKDSEWIADLLQHGLLQPSYFLLFAMDKAGNHEFFMHINTTTIVVNFLHKMAPLSEEEEYGH